MERGKVKRCRACGTIQIALSLFLTAVFVVTVSLLTSIPSTHTRTHTLTRAHTRTAAHSDPETNPGSNPASNQGITGPANGDADGWDRQPEEDELLTIALEYVSSQNPGGIAFVTFFSPPWTSMLLNMIFSLYMYGGGKGILLLTIDSGSSLTACRKLPVNALCMDGSRFVGPLAGNASEELVWDTRAYTQLTWARPKFIHHVLGLSVHMPIVMLDADMVFVKNTTQSLLDGISGGPAGFACTCEQEHCNMGFYALRPHERVREFFRALLRYESETKNDQVTFMLVEPKLPRVDKQCLSWSQHWQSCSWSQPEDNSPFDDEQAISLHAVCLVGLQTKRLHFHARKVWFMPDDPAEQRRLFKMHGLQLPR